MLLRIRQKRKAWVFWIVNSFALLQAFIYPCSILVARRFFKPIHAVAHAIRVTFRRFVGFRFLADDNIVCNIDTIAHDLQIDTRFPPQFFVACPQKKSG